MLTCIEERPQNNLKAKEIIDTIFYAIVENNHHIIVLGLRDTL